TSEARRHRICFKRRTTRCCIHRLSTHNIWHLQTSTSHDRTLHERRNQCINSRKKTKSKPWTGEMGKKKENIKLRDLEPSKDAKGGRATYAGPTYAGILRE